MTWFRALAWLYLGLFSAITVLDVRDSRRRGYSATFIGLDILLAGIATAGYLLLLLEVDSTPTRTAWKLVSPVLLAGMVAVSLHEIHQLDSQPDPELSEREHYWILLTGSILGIALLVPILLANLVYAYAPRLWPAR